MSNDAGVHKDTTMNDTDSLDDTGNEKRWEWLESGVSLLLLDNHWPSDHL